MVRAMRLLALVLSLGFCSTVLPAAVFAQPAGSKQVGPNVPPEIPPAVYRARRDRVAHALGGCVAVLKAQKQSGEGKYDEYFFYLTGLKESGAMITLAPKEPIYKQRLALRSRDPEAERWEGYREPMSYGLRKKYGFDHVGRTRGSVGRGFHGAVNRARCIAKLRSAFSKPDIDAKTLGKFVSSYGARTVQKWQELRRIRATHDAAGIARMDKAIAITIEGHRAAARELVAGSTERGVASKIEDAFFAHGATDLAFPSIVAAGPNGAVLHWTKRDRVVQKDDLVVVDIGSSYGGYASDITRTYPSSGTFSPEQKKIYETVLAVQNKVIAAVRPGISLNRLHHLAETELAKAGFDLAHGLGHFVGLNVHDTGDSSAPLEPGMVITVEPGIYLRNKFGVRIEDQGPGDPEGQPPDDFCPAAQSLRGRGLHSRGTQEVKSRHEGQDDPSGANGAPALADRLALRVRALPDFRRVLHDPLPQEERAPRRRQVQALRRGAGRSHDLPAGDERGLRPRSRHHRRDQGVGARRLQMEDR